MSLVEDQSLVGRALAIADTLKHPIYDCLYLALAEMRDALLVTADGRFLRRLQGSPFEGQVRGLG